MNNNPLIKAVESGLIKPNQILQSVVRGTLSDEMAAMRKVFNSSSSNPAASGSYLGSNNFFKATDSDIEDQLSPPIKSVGETEVRIAPMYMNVLEKTDASDVIMDSLRPNRMNIGKLLEDNPGYSLHRSPSLISNDEYMRRRQVLATRAAEAALPLFIATNDWMAALSPVVKDVKDEEVVLPFPACKFRLDYLEGKPIVTIRQNQDTLEITVTEAYAIQGEAVEGIAAFYKQHILFVCIALEMELASKSGEINKDLGMKPDSFGRYREEYKILPITKKSKPGSHNINTGKTKQRLHVKRSHWRTYKGERRRIKWFFAGDIELGIIVKDYVIE